MIKGLGLSGSLNEAGKIKIGKKGEKKVSTEGKEFRQPVKFDHFEIVTTEKDEHGDFILDKVLMDKLIESKTGMVNSKGELIGIPIRLLFNDVHRNFPTSLVSYVNGKMNCRGDGEKAFKRVDEFKKTHKCPCDRIKDGYDGTDKCKPFGTLTCFIDGTGLFGQAHRFRTTSKNTVNGILGGMQLISKATNGRLAGVPLMLTMTSKTASIPGGGSTTVYILSICYRGSMSDLRQDALGLSNEEKTYLIEMDSDFSDAETEKDIADEFYPSAGIKEVKPSSSSDTEKTKQENDKKSDKESDKELETDNDPGQGENNDGNLDSGEELLFSAEEIEDMKPVGSYRALYERFEIEKNLESAIKLSKRLKKSNLMYWLIKNYSDVEFEKNAQKPVIEELVKDVLTSVHGEGSGSGEEKEKSVEKTGKQEKPKEEKGDSEINVLMPERESDDSGMIQKTQLREIVTLKNSLQLLGLLVNNPSAWGYMVSFFADSDGKPLTSAKGLTINQANNFIAMMTEMEDKKIAAKDLPDGPIPF